MNEIKHLWKELKGLQLSTKAGIHFKECNQKQINALSLKIKYPTYNTVANLVVIIPLQSSGIK
jgi:hypothetical protein